MFDFSTTRDDKQYLKLVAWLVACISIDHDHEWFKHQWRQVSSSRGSIYVNSVETCLY